ncbi:hypothetical protein J4E81_007293 [Alternaria sp. BMP 2799]|nr:hypothetical protein J4E81_007293 [Alternaria sp. BMP 2799]
MNIAGQPWLESTEKLEKVQILKEIYIVVCEDDDTKKFAAILTCNQEGQTKLLRTELSLCPVVAVRTLVDGLQKDTAKLFLKYTVGSQIRGQQGYTDKDTNIFELWDGAHENRIRGPDDDTQGLLRSWSDAPGAEGRPPSGPRGDGYFGRNNKRMRPVERPEKPVVETEIVDLDYYD